MASAKKAAAKKAAAKKPAGKKAAAKRPASKKAPAKRASPDGNWSFGGAERLLPKPIKPKR